MNCSLMLKIRLSLFLMLFSLAFHAQQIENVDFTVNNNTVFVTYDLVNCPFGQLFNISLKFIDEKENIILPDKIAGDYLKMSSGKKYRIIWDVFKDGKELKGNVKAVVGISKVYLRKWESNEHPDWKTNPEVAGMIESRSRYGAVEARQWINSSGMADSIHLYLDNGVVYKENRFLTGELNGRCVERNGNGSLIQVITWKLGLMEGKFEHYRDGKLDAQGQYFQGKRSGYWKWFSDDEISREGNYNEEGEKNGVWKYYGFNGKLERTVKYVNGEELN